MKTFGEYTQDFAIQYDSGVLDYSPVPPAGRPPNGDFYIYTGTEPLLTPGGNLFSHPSEDFIRMIQTDLQLRDVLQSKNLSAPLLYAFKKDILDKGDDPFLSRWNKLLDGDPFVRVKLAPRSSGRAFGPDEPLFSFSFTTVAALTRIVNDFTGKVLSQTSLVEIDEHPFPAAMMLFYTGLSADQRVAIQALSDTHQSHIVLPLLLVAGEIDANTYAKGLIALRMQPDTQYPALLAEVAAVMSYLDTLVQRNNASQGKNMAALIAEGEGDSIEFKSTLRWDLRANKPNPAIERASLKTIAAFLNSSGGVLLIGVRDDGSIEGIESDKLANEDKFLLHLWMLIRNCIGKDFTPYIRTQLEKIDDKTVCMVSCAPAERPVFLKQPNFDEEMYIRVGPSSNAMTISEALRYTQDHFGGGRG